MKSETKKTKPETKPGKKRSHHGPGKKIYTIYMDTDMHAKMVKRADSLDMTLAKYVQALGRRDLGEGGDFAITPSIAPQVAPDKR